MKVQSRCDENYTPVKITALNKKETKTKMIYVMIRKTSTTLNIAIQPLLF